MERLASAKSKSFKWTQSGKVSTLTSNGEVYAQVTWVRSSGSLATAESGDGRWTLKRVGFLRPRVTVRIEGSQSDLAMVAMEWSGGGNIVFSDGPAFSFRSVGFWRPELVITDSAGNRVLTITPSAVHMTREATLELKDETASSSIHVSLLAILGWYLGVLVTQYDQEASPIGPPMVF